MSLEQEKPKELLMDYTYSNSSIRNLWLDPVSAIEQEWYFPKEWQKFYTKL